MPLVVPMHVCVTQCKFLSILAYIPRKHVTAGPDRMFITRVNSIWTADRYTRSPVYTLATGRRLGRSRKQIPQAMQAAFTA